MSTSACPPLRIFLVENHEDSRMMLTMLLEQDGHHVASAASMREALDALPGAACDVLISDIGLPDGNGWELLARLQLVPPVYAVAMSGYGMQSDRDKSRAAGFRHHLVKPMDTERLDRILREAASEIAARPA